MKDKVVFFILGALLATLAYFVGDINLSADNELDGLEVIPKLLVKNLQAESILVGFSDTYRIRIAANHESATIGFLSTNGKQEIALWVLKETEGEAGEAFIAIGDATGKFRIMNTSSVDIFHQDTPDGNKEAD